MRWRVILCVTGALAVFGFAIALAQPRVAVEEPVESFGEVWQGQPVSATFVLTNVGRARLELSGIEATCACTDAKIDQNSVPAGDSTRVVVQFDSSILVGAVDKTIAVMTNDPLQREVRLTVRGIVHQEFQLPSVVAIKADGSSLVGQIRIHPLTASRIVEAGSSDRRALVSLRFDGSDALVKVAVPKRGVDESYFGVLVVKTSSPFMSEIRVPLVISSE